MNCINDIINYFDDEIQNLFNILDNEILDRMSEIRLRVNKPVIIVIKNTSYFIDNNADLYDYVPHNAVIISEKQIDDLYMSFCEYSVYSKIESLKNGYITIKGGCRIGIGASAIYDDYGNIISVKDVTSLNIRIANNVEGCSLPILNSLYINSFPSIIVTGAPNSGKSTFLRDLSIQLSSGFNNSYKKIAVIDERNELDGLKHNLGVNTDVLSGFSKSKGIEIATRVLSPEMIICDEIATIEELDSIKYAFSCGISFAVSVHIKNKNELYSKEILRNLIMTNEFSYIVMLNNYTYNAEIVDVTEVYGKIYRSNCIDSLINGTGLSFIQSTKN